MDHCKTRELKSVKTKYIDGASLTSYKCKSNKTVLILSSIQDKVSIDPTTKKPNCVSVYNSLKGEVDIIDQMTKTLTIRRPAKKWTSAYFLRFMDFILLNSFTKAKQLKIIDSKISRFDFQLEVKIKLMLPSASYRLETNRIL
uniref:DDE_Tnp_1_7 domain-containing protein n=1 Tax=Strongyloides venezuelensis TaxID=75913 RepID=A0A0K0G2N4_STRVS